MNAFLQTVADNAAFLLTCLAIFAGLVVLAWIVEALPASQPAPSVPGQNHQLCGHVLGPGGRHHAL